MVATWTAVLWYDDIEPVDHPTLSAARLLWQYRGERPRLQGFLEAFANDLQSIEDVSLDVLTERWPLTAIGEQLDTLGRIIRQGRAGLADDAYRMFILGRIMVNKGDGTIPEFLDLCEFLGCETIYVDSGWCELRVDVTDAEYGYLIGVLTDDLTAAGVRLIWIWNEYEEDDCFAFGDTLGADETNATGGFGDLTGTTQTTGGYFSGTKIGD